MKTEFEFNAFKRPKAWNGRYRRIPGREPAFHAMVNDTITAQWTDHDEDERLTAKIVANEAAKALARAVNDLKEEHSGVRGGSFLINEYGQVIAPVNGSGARFWVGNIKGIPKFTHPVTHQRFSLLPDDSSSCDDPWLLPYIGIAYNLSYNDEIYFKHQDDDGEEKWWLDGDYPELVSLLRRVRPSGAVRFIVNLHGAIVTKVEYTDGIWRPHFVGMIDYESWYDKET